MWKKEDTMPEYTTPNPDRAAQPGLSTANADTTQRATVGRSIVFRGDLSGEEDLIIQGRVEGSVNLGQHSVTVGPDGEVIASIVGRVVTVEGRVEGNIDGAEQVTLKSSSYVKGDITAPRVVLENGARFRGLVDMGDSEDTGTWTRNATNGQAARPNTNGKSQKEAPVTPRIAEPATNGVLETAGAAGGKGARTGEAGSQLA